MASAAAFAAGSSWAALATELVHSLWEEQGVETAEDLAGLYASEQEGSWSSASVGVRRHYARLEAQDRERAIATKRHLLRTLCDASDGGAWASTFTGDVIGYVPRLGVYYIVGRPALMVFTDASDLASHMPVESRHLIYALFMVAELDYFFTPPE